MSHFRAPVLACAALALGLTASAGRAAEVQATPACRTCRPATSAYAGPSACCPDPCKRVGPIRRLLRRIFRPCCATPPPPAVVAVVPPPMFVPPQTGLPGAPPAQLGRPFVPPPGTGSSIRREMPRLTQPTPPPPVRVDRIASQGGAGVQATLVSRSSKPVPNAKVALIHADKADLRRQLAADGEGRVNADLEAGTWLVYSRDNNGRFVYRGKLQVSGKETLRAKLLVE